jgi:hypothetical protein
LILQIVGQPYPEPRIPWPLSSNRLVRVPFSLASGEELVKVFISYAHEADNPAHSAKVRAFADRLKSLGLEVLIDLDDPDPQLPWTLWMEKQLRAADWVLMVCTKTYWQRFYDEERGQSYGVRWEGMLIRTLIGVEKEQWKKYKPVLFEGGMVDSIPTPLRDRTHYEIKSFVPEDRGFADLVRAFTGRDIKSEATSDRPRLLEFEILRRLSDGGEPDGYNVRLRCEELGSGEDRFDGDPLNEELTKKKLEAIDAGRGEKDSLKWVGMQLWEGLIAGKVQQLFNNACHAALEDGRMFHFRLRMPPELEVLPWEALFNDAENYFLATRERFCVIRAGSSDARSRPFGPAPPPPAVGHPPGILLVMPKGSGLDLARERRTILERTAALSDMVQVAVLDGTVTAKALGEQLRSRPWAVVHFAGHGRVNDRGEVELQLNDDAGEARWVDTDVFATLFNNSAVRLVLLNCCRAATVAVARGVAAMGPVLIGQGVAAVIAMRYEVTDDIAVSFADEFYRVLLSGKKPGRVDMAVEAARSAIFLEGAGDRNRGFISPALYLAPGGDQLFSLPAAKILPTVSSLGPTDQAKAQPMKSPEQLVAGAAGSPGVAIPNEPSKVEIPKKLIAAVRERRCVPVLGAGLLTAAVFRDSAPPPGLRQLTKKLADGSGYPEPADFDLLERGGAWLDGPILRRVCQYYIDDEDRAADLNRLIESEFSAFKPPEVVAKLAGWDVPGYICLHFDGLLEQALIARERRFVALTLDDPAPADLELLRLVQLCGTCRGRDKKAAALTEQKYDALWDRLAKPPDWLTNLITAGEDRSLLLLGIHPRDALARRLVSRLYAKGVANEAGPIYCASTEYSAADQAYWKSFNVRWIKRNSGDLIFDIETALSAAKEGGRA